MKPVIQHRVRIGCSCIAILLLAGCRPEDGRLVFEDSFRTNSLSSYRMQVKRANKPDEYGNQSLGDTAQAVFQPGLHGVYIEASDGNTLTLSRSVAAVTSGVVVVRFKPLATYPANGQLTLEARGRDSVFSFTMAGGYYETALAIRVNDREVAADARKGPYFTTMDELGGYDGEMTVRWAVQDPQLHTLELWFSPDGAAAYVDGQQVREIIASAGAPDAITEVSIRAYQLECLLDDLKVSSF
jgi:hypothetical protein